MLLIVPVYIGVGREVQLGPDWSRGGDGSKHQLRKLQQGTSEPETLVALWHKSFYNPSPKNKNLSANFYTTDLPLEPGRQSAGVRASKAHPGVVAGQVEALSDVLVEHRQVQESERQTDRQTAVDSHVLDHRWRANTYACWLLRLGRFSNSRPSGLMLWP